MNVRKLAPSAAERESAFQHLRFHLICHWARAGLLSLSPQPGPPLSSLSSLLFSWLTRRWTEEEGLGRRLHPAPTPLPNSCSRRRAWRRPPHSIPSPSPLSLFPLLELLLLPSGRTRVDSRRRWGHLAAPEGRPASSSAPALRAASVGGRRVAGADHSAIPPRARPRQPRASSRAPVVGASRSNGGWLRLQGLLGSPSVRGRRKEGARATGPEAAEGKTAARPRPLERELQ